MPTFPTRFRVSPEQRRPAVRLSLIAAALQLAVAGASAQTATWTGAGGDLNWNNAANWSGSSAPDAAFLIFGAVPGLGAGSPITLNNDVIPTFTFYGDLTFQAGAAAYTLTGNVVSIDLYGTTQSITNNTVNVTQTLNLPVFLQRAATVNAAAGNIAIGGIISGTNSANSLTKTGANNLILSGANTFTGALIINAGAVRATTSASALGTGAVTLAGGRLELANNSGLAFNRNLTVSSNATITSDRLTAGAGVTHTLGTLAIGAQTLSVARGGAVTSGTAGLTLGAATLSASGAVFDTGSGAQLTLASVSGNNFGFTVQGAGNTTISGTVATGTGTLAKNGAGTLTLAAATSFSGATTISGGTLVAAATNALRNTTAITVNNGGTLLLAGTGDRVDDDAAINLAGGTLATGGTSEGSAGNAGLGTLTLSATSTLDFGAGSGSIIAFAGVGPQTPGAILQIVNWNGIGKTGGGTERLLFDGVSTSFTSQFAQNEVSFNGQSGYVAIQYTGSGGFYEITAIPEPATIFGAFALVGLAGWRERRRLAALFQRSLS